MCSNTSSGSYGELADDFSGSCPKKHKKDKVRRRGPGVAELEKIRLQEENHSTTPTSTPTPLILGDLVMMSPNLPLSDKQQQQQQPPRITPPIFPFSSYIVNGSFPKDFIPPAPIFQRKQTPLNQPNGGLFQFLEPPSNQKHRLDHFSQFLEDEKIIGMKRPWHFLTDTNKATIGATIPISRDVKQTRSSDLRLKSPVQDSGTTICNPITIDSPSQQLPLTSIRSFPRDFPRFIPLNLQYEQQQDVDEYMQRRNVGNKKPFYSFIPLDERSNGDRDKHFNLKTERYEAAAAADHGIDLSLKL